MKNSHASGAAYQTPTDGLLLQKKRDTFKAEVCGNRKAMPEDDFQPDGRGRRGDNRGGGRLQVPGMAYGPVRRQLAACQTEY